MDKFLKDLELLIAQGRHTSEAWTGLGEEMDLAVEETYPDNLPPFDDIIRRWAGWLDELRRNGVAGGMPP